MNDATQEWVQPRDAAMAAMTAIRGAQPDWANRPIRHRLGVISRLRRILAVESQGWATTAARPNMTEADILVAEVMPSLSAFRFVERQAARVIATRRLPGRGPMWLLGARLRVRRVPYGGILIIAPRNYPLFLPTVQVVQALVAGNGVMVKPAPGFAGPMRFLADALQRAGLPTGLFMVLPDTQAAGAEALRAGADKVVLTGGAETGRRVLTQLAGTVTPATMELSGDDALIVLPGAPIDAVARAIGYALLLNGGETCIAPRRIIAVGDTGPALAARLKLVLADLPPRHVPSIEAAHIRFAIALAELNGGRVIGDTLSPSNEAADLTMRPLVMLVQMPEHGLPPLFGPVASLLMVSDTDQAIAIANASTYALGASVFGPSGAAQAVARQLRAGCVVVNDVIVPTADPRLPFGGAGASGFGVTRGAEGLLEMTRPQAIVSRHHTIAMQYRLLPTASGRWIARFLRLLYG